jgi:hypothetical protein
MRNLTLFRALLSARTLLPAPLLAAVLLSAALAADAQRVCTDLKSGDFYYYPRNTLLQHHVIVSGDRQKVVNMVRQKGALYNDSTVFRIEWKDDCDYTLKYLEGSGLSDDVLKFQLKHTVVYHIDTIGPDYYVFSAYQDHLSPKTLMVKDTMWMHPQSHSAANMLFELTDPGRIRQVHFSDTSRMALLYIYRPGKFKLSFSDLLILYNDLPIVVLKNKSAAVVALYKEGPFTLRSIWPTQRNVEGDLPLDIHFGKTYFIRADAIWGIHTTGNSKLALTLMDPNEGQQDFDSIYQTP